MKALSLRKSLRAEAGDPTTPTGRLRELARSGRAKEVAANPNAPVDLLLKLAARHFDAFLANPVLPLLLVEDPGFCLKISGAALRRLLRREQLPATFLQTLNRHPDPEVRGAAKLHVAALAAADVAVELNAALHSLPPRSGLLPTLLRFDLLPLWLLEPLGGATDNELRREVLASLKRRTDEPSQALWRLLERGGLRPPAPNTWTGMAPNLTPGELERLARSGPAARWQAAQHPLTPLTTLQRLAADASARVALAALGNRSLPEATLWAYAGAPEERCRLKVARNPGCPPRLLDQLSHDGATAVRAAVARHHAASDATLSRLAADPDKTVVLAVLANRRTGPASLEILSRSPEPSIRRAVARHPCTPLSVGERLAEDADAKVRRALARKGNLTRETFIRLCCDPDDSVARDARCFRPMLERYRHELFTLPKSPEELAAVLRDWTPRPPREPAPVPPLPPWRPRRTYWREHLTDEQWARVHRAMNADVSEEELAELARDTVPKVRGSVAWNPRTPPAILRALASDSETEVRRHLAINNATPADVLAHLARDTDADVCRFVAYKQAAPPEALAALSASPDPGIRRAAAYNVNTPTSALRRLAGEADLEMRRTLARNHSTPADLLKQFLAGAGPDLREELARNVNLPWELAVELADDSHATTRKNLAATAKLNDRLGARLAGDTEPAVRAAAAGNPSLPAEFVARLVDDAAPVVRRALAGRADLAEDLVRRLAADTAPGMAEVLARNPRTPPDILAGYAKHPETGVRSALAYNPNTPPAALLTLAEDAAMLLHLSHRNDKPPELEARLNNNASPDFNRAHALLREPGTPTEVFEKIIREGKKEEVQGLLYSDQTPEPVLLLIARAAERDHRWALLFRRRMPPAIAAILARDPDTSVRGELACRHRLPEEVLRELLADTALPDYFRRRMRVSLAQRPDTPPALLLQIAREEVALVKDGTPRHRSRFRRSGSHRDEHVLAAIAERTEVPVGEFEDALGVAYPPFQAALLKRPDLPPPWRPFIEDVTLATAVRGVARLARLASLTHPRVPREDLIQFAERGTWLERYAVTQNPAAPAETLTLLAADANVLVRGAARTRLAEPQRSKS